MKKQVKKISLKTDKIVTLSNTQVKNVLAGARPSGNASEWVNNRPTCL